MCQTPVTKLFFTKHVRGTTHVGASADRRRRPTSANNRQSPERYGGARPCRALYTRTASLNSNGVEQAVSEVIVKDRRDVLTLSCLCD